MIEDINRRNREDLEVLAKLKLEQLERWLLGAEEMLISNSHFHVDHMDPESPFTPTNISIQSLKDKIDQVALCCLPLNPFLDEIDGMFKEYQTLAEDRTKYFFFYKQEIIKDELLQKYWELTNQSLGSLTELLAAGLQKSRAEFEADGIKIRSRIAGIEFQLNRRLLEIKPNDQINFKNLWAAAEQVQILHQRIKQNEMRVNLVLLPQVERITSAYNEANKNNTAFLAKCTDQSVEEEKLMTLIESINSSRRSQLNKLLDIDQIKAFEEIKKILNSSEVVEQ